MHIFFTQEFQFKKFHFKKITMNVCKNLFKMKCVYLLFLNQSKLKTQ